MISAAVLVSTELLSVVTGDDREVDEYVKEHREV